MLSGWKTYIAAGLMVLAAAAQLAGIDTHSFVSLTPGDLLLGALTAVGLRHAIATSAT